MVVHIFLCCSLTGDETTDVSPTQEPTAIVWIIVGAVALFVLIVVFSTVCLCGFICSRKQKRMDTFHINTGISWGLKHAVLYFL